MVYDSDFEFLVRIFVFSNIMIRILIPMPHGTDFDSSLLGVDSDSDFRNLIPIQ